MNKESTHELCDLINLHALSLWFTFPCLGMRGQIAQTFDAQSDTASGPQFTYRREALQQLGEQLLIERLHRMPQHCMALVLTQSFLSARQSDRQAIPGRLTTVLYPSKDRPVSVCFPRAQTTLGTPAPVWS
jgi:hypothetical protein